MASRWDVCLDLDWLHLHLDLVLDSLSRLLGLFVDKTDRLVGLIEVNNQNDHLNSHRINPSGCRRLYIVVLPFSTTIL